jgi:hypothetical protein
MIRCDELKEFIEKFEPKSIYIFHSQKVGFLPKKKIISSSDADTTCVLLSFSILSYSDPVRKVSTKSLL